jgi:SAM-dependent methyltransferase
VKEDMQDANHRRVVAQFGNRAEKYRDERLPFPDGAFHLVVCRFAAHHFADFHQAVREMARVLAPGGRVLAIDHYAPEDEAMDGFINEIDRTRDPSHVREWRLSQWEAAFAAAGLAFSVRRRWDLALDFANWVDRAGTPPEARARLAQRLAEAPPASRAEFRIALDEAGQPVSFCLKAALVEGRKGRA